MGAAVTLVVVSNTEQVFVVDDAIDLAKGDVLIEAAGKGSSRRQDLGGQVGMGSKKTRVQPVYGWSVVYGQGLVADLTFIIADIKKTIVDDWPTDRAAKLLSSIMRFGNPLLLVDLVVGAEGGIKDVVIAVAVNLVGAALRHSVHQSSSGLAELSFESCTRDLEFANYVFAELKRNARAPDLLRKKGIVVVAAVDGVVVEIS